MRVDPESLKVLERIKLPGMTATFLAAGAGSLWITQPSPGFAGAVPSSILRISLLNRNSVWRLDATTGRVEAIIPTGQESLALAAGADAVWVTNQAAGTVSRIDPRTNRVVKTIELGFNPHGVVVADGGVWVAIAQGRI